MIHHWNEQDIHAAGDDRAQCAYAACLLGAEPSLGLAGQGSVSLKFTAANRLGEEEHILAINPRGRDLSSIGADDFVALRREPLGRLVALDSLTPAQLENELACQRVVAAAAWPPAEAVLHAALPDRLVAFVRPTALQAIAGTPSASDHLRRIYGESLAIVTERRAGLPLARACAEARRAAGDILGLALLHHGLVTFGETAREMYERLIDLVTHAERYLQEHGAWEIALLTVSAPAPIQRADLAALRQTVSEAVGYPVILSACDDAFGFAQREDLSRLVPGAHIAEQPWRKEAPPRILFAPGAGLYAIGRTAEDAALNGQWYRSLSEVIARASALEKYQPLSAMSDDLENLAPDRQGMFAGEIALVTGAASGIGKACAQSLLAGGAAVIGLDVSPRIAEVSGRPGYLGLVCDVTDEAAIARAFDAAVKTFGGLDMLVLNAGVFPPGTRIEVLELATWQKVMRVNLDANLSLLREAYPLLKRSPRGGRVLVNASKNVLAPGAGAAAYSASKAGLTQLARVAALEWGQDKIRVNMIHPDAVFDTGIWTDEVLRARAAHYGMTIQQYKTRNVLGVELNSRYVAELVAEMLGPLFEKITGAQISVDGGNDRVI